MCRVLVVDDDADIRETMSFTLRLEGHEVHTAENGEQALSFLETSPRPDLILLDLMMPVMNGIEFRKQQLQKPDWAEIPVIIMTASVNYRDHAEELSPFNFMPKPVNFDLLCDTVKKLPG